MFVLARVKLLKVVTDVENLDFLMFVPKELLSKEEYIKLLLNTTCGRTEDETPQAGLEPGYVTYAIPDVYFSNQCPNCLHRPF